MGISDAATAGHTPAQRPSGSEVKLQAVTRTYHLGAGTLVRAIDTVTLDIRPGTVVSVTGPSGSGKSTLLQLIGAIDRPDSGHVIVDGTDIATLSRRAAADYRRGIGFVFQQFNLLPALTALDNVIAPVLPYRTGYDKRARARELLDAVGLGSRLRSLPSQLSGGEQQRVAIARALVNRPHLLLADEPTGNLDSTTGRQIIDVILNLRGQYGITVIIATHDPAVATRADHSVRLRDGRIEN